MDLIGTSWSYGVQAGPDVYGPFPEAATAKFWAERAYARGKR
jgi:hypothetical protein